MPNFIIDNTALPFPKSDLVPLQVGADGTKYVVATDWNTVCQALTDVQGVLRGASWYGLTGQAADPAPASITDYLWLGNDGLVYITLSGVASALGGGSDVTRYVLKGSTAGLATGESVELKYGISSNQTIQFTDLNGCLVIVEAVARGNVSAAPNVVSFRQQYAVKRDGGITTIEASGAADHFGTAAADAQWTLVASIGTVPDRLVLTFATGTTQTAAKVVANVKIVRVVN